MTRIEKLICDSCGKEKDLLELRFGGEDNWQMLLKNVEPYEQRQERHVCSTECAIKLLTIKE